jgi:hypothetical protein
LLEVSKAVSKIEVGERSLIRVCFAALCGLKSDVPLSLRLIQRNARFTLESGHPPAPGGASSVPEAEVAYRTVFALARLFSRLFP